MLVDLEDRSTIDILVQAVGALGDAAPAGEAGDAAREAMAIADAALRRYTSGESQEFGDELAVVASCFETARSSLTHTPVLERSRAGERSDDDPELASPAVPVANPLAEDAELVADFVARSQEHLDNADTLLLTLERAPGDHEALDATFRVFHTIKGMAGFLGFHEIEKFAHDTESFLDGPRKGQSAFSTEAFDAVFAAVDGIRALIAARSGAPTVSPRHPQADVGTVSLGDTATGPEGLSPSPGGGGDDRRSNSGRRVTDSFVRVDEERLDLLLDTIGELVIAEAMVSEAARADIGAWGVLREGFSRLDKITRELQEMATSLRMVPLKGTFGRMARLARDLGQKAGKKIEFVMEGEETELDKAMVDLISDPLVHLMRNSVDHGIESPTARTKSGKPKAGRITLRAYHAGGSVCIEVEDDGRGLDTQQMLATGIQQGLVKADEHLTEREIHNLIFRPGFSTAKKVTDVSGRGVGMDVVKRAVEGLRGVVEITSAPGVGTRFTLRLPLTLAIIDGMVLRVGAERYILPTLAIQRSVRPVAEEISTVLGRGEMFAADEGMVPLVRLSRLFDVRQEDPHPTEGIVVLVGENGSRAGLVASELLGQQQTVIKPLGESVNDTPGISGGAIMPDGTVGLILDVSGIVRLANAEGGE